MKHRIEKNLLLRSMRWTAALGATVFAADWPHWRGPDRSGISAETNWNPKALSDSTKPLWTASVGTGFSAVSIAEGKAITMGNVDKTTDMVVCLDALTGQSLWTYRYEEPLTPNMYEGGPSATPTIHDKKVYTVSKSGKMLCLDLETGALIWRRQTDCKKPEWGFAGSPVILEEKAIYNIGSCGLALDKETGQILWQSGREESGYATAVPFTMDGKTQLALFSKEHLYSVDPADGRILWSYPWKTNWDVNASDPILKDDEALITSGYNHGATLLKISGSEVRSVWENKNLRSQLSGPVLINGYIYGIDENQLACLDWKSGQVRWTEKTVGKGSLTAAGDKLIVLSDKGRLIIAQATDEQFAVISSAQILSGRCWTTPVLANGLIYARNAKGDLVCIDLRIAAAASALDSEPVITAAELGGRTVSQDWSCWQGPDRNNKSPETGLLKKWPPEGPALLWSAEDLGSGYSSASVANKKIYVTGLKNKRGVLSCLDWDGKLIWTADYGPEWTGSYPGVRSSPVIWDGAVYVVSGNGQIGCYSAETGKELWAADPFREFEGKMPQWGIAMSPVLVEGKLIFTVGSPKAAAVALDAKKGHIVWKSAGLDERPTYCTPAVFQWGGRTILAGMTQAHLFAVDARTGDLFWSYPIADYLAGRNRQIHPNTPVFWNGGLLFTSGYDMGAIKFSITSDGWTFQKEWTNAEFDCHHGGVVYQDGYVYGTTWKGNDDGLWACIDWKTGEMMYAQRWHNKGSILWADGLFYAYAEKAGAVGLIKADPKEFQAISEFLITQGKGEHWAHPVISGGRLFIRHGEGLMGYGIKS